jgi:NAD(P)-dependent dehydrogenase (short-subunit alcohol dehydrogenase family)
MKRFTNKVAVITGGGSGIGLEAAKALVLEGAKVVINGRDESKLLKAAKMIDASGKNVSIFAGDISKPETSYALVKHAETKFGGVDILFNNAGWFSPTPFIDHDEKLYDGFVDIILKGRFFAAQAAVKAMKRRGSGAIVQTGSMWAFEAIGATPASAYSAAYAGVHMLTKSIAIEHAKDKIRINTVAPAVVETPAYDTFLSPEEREKVLPTFNQFHPLGRNGQPADIVSAMLFLASDEASWITGTILPVDGGVTAGRQ